MNKFESVRKCVYNHWNLAKFVHFNGIHIVCMSYKDRTLLFTDDPYPNFAFQIEESLYNSLKWKDNK